MQSKTTIEAAAPEAVKTSWRSKWTYLNGVKQRKGEEYDDKEYREGSAGHPARAQGSLLHVIFCSGEGENAHTASPKGAPHSYDRSGSPKSEPVSVCARTRLPLRWTHFYLSSHDSPVLTSCDITSIIIVQLRQIYSYGPYTHILQKLRVTPLKHCFCARAVFHGSNSGWWEDSSSSLHGGCRGERVVTDTHNGARWGTCPMFMPDMMSIGMGKSTEVPFSAPIKFRVCRYRSCNAVGERAITLAASFRAREAFNSPWAAITWEGGGSA